MKTAVAFAALSLCTLLGTAQHTYNFNASTSDSTITTQLHYGATSGNPPNTYIFAAGTYSPAETWIFPCVNGNIFKGPPVPFTPGTGVSPAATFQPTFSPVSNAVQISGVGTYTVPGSGCTIQFLAASAKTSSLMHPYLGCFFNSTPSTILQGGTLETQILPVILGFTSIGLDPAFRQPRT